MGTRRLWIALLLAVLQYAALAQGSIDCTITPEPPSDCNGAALTPDKECQKLGPMEECPLGKIYKIYHHKASAGVWEEVTVDCPSSSNFWTVTKIGDTQEVLVDAADNIVCAVAHPSAPPSTVCDATAKFPSACPTTPMPAFVECEPITTFAPKTTCDGGRSIFYEPAGTGVWQQAASITCEKVATIDTFTAKTAAGTTIAVLASMDNAVCAKYDPSSKSCEQDTPLDHTCPGDLGGDLQCDLVTSSDVRPLSCTGTKEIFYNQPPAAVWTKANQITCNHQTGAWEAKDDQSNSINLQLNDKVICAAAKPLSCATENTLKSQFVTSDVNPDAACKTITLFPDDQKLACPSPSAESIFFETSAGEWEEVVAPVQCNRATGKWTTGTAGKDLGANDNVVCATMSPKKVLCSTTVAPTSDCPLEPNARSACTPITQPFSDDVGIKTLCPGMSLFVEQGPNVPWLKKEEIKCDLSTGLWKETTNGVKTTVAGTSINIVCANSDPMPLPCTIPPLAAPECLPNIPAATKCQKINLDNVNPLSCSTFDRKIFVRSSDWQEAKDSKIKCDGKTGKWKEGNNKDDVDVTATELICAAEKPVQKKVDCLQLNNDCNAFPNIGCVTPTDTAFAPHCVGGTDKLYFQKTGMSHFQEAQFIDCKGTDWEVKYQFGNKQEMKTMNLATDHLICAQSNPHPAVCQFVYMPVPANYVRLQPDMTILKFEAGQLGKCPEDKFDFVNSKGDSRREGDPIVCDQDGSWITPNGDKFGEKDKVSCAVPRCKSCPTLPPSTSATYPGSVSKRPDLSNSGSCTTFTCDDGTKFLIKEEGETIFRTTLKSPVCDADRNSFVYDGGKLVEAMDCAQKLYCIKANFVQVKRTCADAPEVTECDSPVLKDFPDTDPETLTCPPTKKMFIRSDLTDERYWEEIKTLEVKCDLDLGKWDVKLIDGTEDRKDYQNTIICAGANPQPKSTTTTTTTTPAPLRPICDVCKDALDELDLVTCETCNNATKLDEPNPRAEYGPGDKCELTPGDGRDLLINNFEQVHGNNPLVCIRGERDEKVQWKTTEGTPVSRYSSRLETKKDSWKALSYVVVGAVFVAIGGMGITCVVIFMKMRKQPSSREKKKKERGVTKKYTSSNVVKTGHKSMAATSREGGKSKDGSASKMEDNNEDTPTLKL